MCIVGREAIEVLAVDKSLENTIAHLITLHNNCSIDLFSTGIHIARITNKGNLIPLLGMLNIIKHVKKCYVTVDEKAEKLFLYGRDIFSDSLINYNLDGCEFVVVLNVYGETIGWGKPQKLNHKLLIRNWIDLGWYLRCGL